MCLRLLRCVLQGVNATKVHYFSFVLYWNSSRRKKRRKPPWHFSKKTTLFCWFLDGMKKGKPLYCFFHSGMEVISLPELLVASTTAGTTATEPHYFSLWCRWERGWLRWWLQRVHRRDVWWAAERFPAPPHRHTQRPRRVRRQPRLLPAQPQSRLAPAAEHVPLPGWDICPMLVCFCFCFSCCPRFGWRMWGVWGLTACGTCSSVIVGDGGLPNAEAVGWVSEPQRMHYKRFIHCHDSFCIFCWWICPFMLCVYLLASWGEHSVHCFQACPCWISGILMGIAIRSGSPLSLSIAEPVWKQLAGMPLSISDLTEMDKDFVPGQPCLFSWGLLVWAI